MSLKLNNLLQLLRILSLILEGSFQYFVIVAHASQARWTLVIVTIVHCHITGYNSSWPLQPLCFKRRYFRTVACIAYITSLDHLSSYVYLQKIELNSKQLRKFVLKFWR